MIYDSELAFSLQEACMEVINPFIRDNQQRMVMFIDELSVSNAGE